MNIRLPLKKILLSALSLLIFSLVLSCVSTEKTDTDAAVKIMVRFDKAFIPSLAMTSKGDLQGSEKAMRILLKEWETIKPELTDYFRKDKTILMNINKIDNLIIDAADKLADGTEIIEVHETLEMVKKPFRDIREEKNISYYPDLLEAYHKTMEEILAITSGKTASEITPMEIEEIEKLAVQGTDEWTEISKATLDRDLFGFNDKRASDLKKVINNGLEESKNFVSIVKSGDIENMLKEAAVIKTYYTKVFLQFGDFARLK